MPPAVLFTRSINLVLPSPPTQKPALLPFRQLPRLDLDAKINTAVPPVPPASSRKSDAWLDAAAAASWHEALRSFSTLCIFLATSVRLRVIFACAFLVYIVVLG